MLRVLVIEDNLEIRENTIELLELEGFQVFEASNGKTGLQLARELLPDVILCDIMMPQLNGYEVHHQLKSNPLTAGIAFIFVTASVEKKDMAIAFNMGVDGYVRKPFERDDLINEIERVIRIR